MPNPQVQSNSCSTVWVWQKLGNGCCSPPPQRWQACSWKPEVYRGHRGFHLQSPLAPQSAGKTDGRKYCLCNTHCGFCNAHYMNRSVLDGRGRGGCVVRSGAERLQDLCCESWEKRACMTRAGSQYRVGREAQHMKPTLLKSSKVQWQPCCFWHMPTTPKPLCANLAHQDATSKWIHPPSLTSLCTFMAHSQNRCTLQPVLCTCKCTKMQGI